MLIKQRDAAYDHIRRARHITRIAQKTAESSLIPSKPKANLCCTKCSEGSSSNFHQLSGEKLNNSEYLDNNGLLIILLQK